MNVIPSGNEVIGTGGIDYPEMKQKFLKGLILNISIGESTLVLKPHEDTSLLENVFSVDKTVLENAPTNGSKNPFYPCAKKMNEWITLPEQPINKGDWPCAKIPFKWNFLGCQQNLNKHLIVVVLQAELKINQLMHNFGDLITVFHKMVLNLVAI